MERIRAKKVDLEKKAPWLKRGNQLAAGREFKLEVLARVNRAGNNVSLDIVDIINIDGVEDYA